MVNGIPPGGQMLPQEVKLQQQYLPGAMAHPHVLVTQHPRGITVNHIGGLTALQQASLQIAAALITSGVKAPVTDIRDSEPPPDATQHLAARSVEIALALLLEAVRKDPHFSRRDEQHGPQGPGSAGAGGQADPTPAPPG
jgi:hypothetical protein